MKKLFFIIILSTLLFNNSIAEEINLKCKYPSGNLYNDIIKIDTTKKLAAGKFPFEKGSTDDVIKFVSLLGDGNDYKGLFFTINLIDNTVLYQIVNNITLFDIAKYKNNTFELTKNADEILLGCERLKDNQILDALNVENDTGLIQSNYFCKGVSTYNNLRVFDIEMLEGNKFSASVELISEKETTPFGTYYATFDRGRLIWFILLEKDLVVFQLLSETEGKREFRYIAYALNDVNFNKIKQIQNNMENANTDKEYFDYHDKFFLASTDILKNITMNNLNYSWGENFSCDNNPDTILFANTNNSNDSNLLKYEFTEFEKKFIEEKGYDLDPNTDYYEFDLSNAMVTLGWYYLVGEQGFNKSLKKSLLWNTRASDLGHSTASSNLGLIYYAGLLGESKDLNKAHKFYILAAQQWDTSPHEPSSIIEEMDKYNKNPSHDFKNLKQLFYRAISLRSQSRMNDLINFTDLSNKIYTKISLEDFINKENLVCTNDLKFIIQKKLSNGNLIIKNFFEETESKEQEISLLNYAKIENNKISWFELTDGLPAFNIQPSITKNVIYYDNKISQLVNHSYIYFITQKQFFKVRGPQSIALRERVASLGSANNIKFEDNFYKEASLMFNLVKNDNDPLVSICEY